MAGDIEKPKECTRISWCEAAIDLSGFGEGRGSVVIRDPSFEASEAWARVMQSRKPDSLEAAGRVLALYVKSSGDASCPVGGSWEAYRDWIRGLPAKLVEVLYRSCLWFRNADADDASPDPNSERRRLSRPSPARSLRTIGGGPPSRSSSCSRRGRGPSDIRARSRSNRLASTGPSQRCSAWCSGWSTAARVRAR